ncbi:MAG: response regulator [Rhodospirillales bacterium]|nr:response regulator [Rhodospirillales bacterium]MCC7166710.1 response regulator [Rhodospirillales bacterium]
MAETSVKPFSWARYSFLLADDNAEFRWLLRSVLTRFGVQTFHEAANGADAIQVLHKFPIDVALVDINMEPINGIWFAQMLRNDQANKNANIIVVMVTGHSTPENVQAAREAGVVRDFVSKPLSAKNLQERLTRLLTRYPGRS